MSDLQPLFPLPNVVLFPDVFLPLHIFEPRYRAMVSDALASDRLITMVLLQPGWEADYQGQPAVYAVGCSGVITHVEPLPDGRYNIVLRGVERVHIDSEQDGRPYRRATVTGLPERPPTRVDRDALPLLRARLESLVVPTGSDIRLASGMADDEVVNALAQYLDLDALEKQALLEHNHMRERAEALIDLLEMKMLMARTPSGHRRVTH